MSRIIIFTGIVSLAIFLTSGAHALPPAPQGPYQSVEDYFQVRKSTEDQKIPAPVLQQVPGRIRGQQLSPSNQNTHHVYPYPHYPDYPVRRSNRNTPW